MWLSCANYPFPISHLPELSVPQTVSCVRDFYGAFCLPSQLRFRVMGRKSLPGEAILSNWPFSPTQRLEALRRRAMSERMYGNRKGEQAWARALSHLTRRLKQSLLIYIFNSVSSLKIVPSFFSYFPLENCVFDIFFVFKLFFLHFCFCRVAKVIALNPARCMAFTASQMVVDLF